MGKFAKAYDMAKVNAVPTKPYVTVTPERPSVSSSDDSFNGSFKPLDDSRPEKASKSKKIGVRIQNSLRLFILPK